MIMPFGKHKGRRLEAVPSDYLSWLLPLDNLRSSLRTAVVRELRMRGYHPVEHTYNHRRPEPLPMVRFSPEDLTLARDLVNAGYHVLALKTHPDLGGDNDAMTKLNLVAESLRAALVLRKGGRR